MTKLEDLVFVHPQYKALDDGASRGDRQKVLDEITEEVLGQLSPVNIALHVQDVYDATVGEYVANPHTRDVVDELIKFMELVPDKGYVLDIGCGVGRDAFFMSVKDTSFRESYMGRAGSDGKTTFEKFSVPTTGFWVTAIDNSLAMLEVANTKEQELIEKGLLLRGCAPEFLLADMHRVHLVSLGQFDGIWSCTALFTHTPRELLRPAMESVARVLKPGGIFHLLEDHPVTWLFDREGEDLRASGIPYFGYAETSQGWPSSYLGDVSSSLGPTGRPIHEQCPKYEQLWTIAEVVQALRATGLSIEYLGEHPEPYWDVFPRLTEKLTEKLPMTFSVVARRRETTVLSS